MWKWCVILILLSCKTTQTSNGRFGVTVMTNAQQTAAIVELQFVNDSLKRRLDSIESQMVFLDTTQWKMNSEGKVQVSGNMSIDTLVAVTAIITGRKQDTTFTPRDTTLIDNPTE